VGFLRIHVSEAATTHIPAYRSYSNTGNPDLPKCLTAPQPLGFPSLPAEFNFQHPNECYNCCGTAASI